MDTNKCKIIEEAWSICNSAHRAETLSRFYIGSLKLPNSVGNIKTAESLQKKRKQFASRQKVSPPPGPGSFLDCTTYILIYLLDNQRVDYY